MIKVLLVGCGGFIGSILRYFSYLSVVKLVSQSYVVYGTIFVNLVGCFAIGILAGLFDGQHLNNDNIRLFLMIGVLGGFTTFSTFGLENYLLIKKNCMKSIFL